MRFFQCRKQGLRLVHGLLIFARWRGIRNNAATDIFMLLSRREPWGIVVNEAAASNLKQAYDEILQLGRLTGHVTGANAVVRSSRTTW